MSRQEQNKKKGKQNNTFQNRKERRRSRSSLQVLAWSYLFMKVGYRLRKWNTRIWRFIEMKNLGEKESLATLII